MVLLQKWPFFQLFFFAISARKTSFTIFQNVIKPFKTIKKRNSKSRKIDIFSKGLTHTFPLKMVIFPTFFFQAISARETSFTIFQNAKTPFKAIKTRSSKSRKFVIFPKGLTHGFCPKMAIFPFFFFLGHVGHKNVIYNILELENAFLGYKNKNVKNLKNLHFSKGVNPSFLSKNGRFATFFFQAI